MANNVTSNLYRKQHKEAGNSAKRVSGVVVELFVRAVGKAAEGAGVSMKIYLAGKITITKDYDKGNWREEIIDFSEYCLSRYSDTEFSGAWPIKKGLIFGKHDYVGPYVNSSPSHIGDQVDSIHSNLSINKIAIANRCRSAIGNADLVFAWIDSEDCHGTLVELGYAYALRKDIFIAYDSAQFKPLRNSTVYANYEENYEGGNWDCEDPLWFAGVFCYSGTKPSYEFSSARKALDWYLNHPTNVPYQEYLQSEHWKQTRQGALERAGYRCQVCGITTNLQVHHVTYENLGAELPHDLTVLCKEHHSLFHKSKVRGDAL